MGLTPKERFLRGFDTLGAELPSYVHSRMQDASAGRPWFPLHLALEEQRGRFTKNVSPDDPREMVKVLQRYPDAFPEVTEEGRRQLRLLARLVNTAAHSTQLTEEQAVAGLSACLSVATLLGLDEPARRISPLLNTDAGGQPSGATADASDQFLTEASTETGQVGASVELADESGTITFETDRYAVRVQFLTALNFALAHNSVSLLSDLTIENKGSEQLRQIEVRSALVGLGEVETSGSEEKTVAVPSVAEHATRVVEARDLLWRLPDSVFAAATEPWNIELRVSLWIGGELQGAQTVPLVVHPADEWWMSGAKEALSSFVRPNEHFISELLRRVSNELHKTTGQAELVGYQGGPQRVRETAEAAYRVLLDAGIDYVEPPPSFRVGSQRIRGHREVVEKQLGTCLDLAVLYAALLEAAGIAPVLVLGKDHAFTGYLQEDTQLSESFITAPSALHTVTQSDMFESVELTGVTGRDKSLSFEEAQRAAASWWPSRIDDVVGLIDVRAAHRWFRPLPTLAERDGVLVIEKVVEAPPHKQRPDSGPSSYSRVSESVPERVSRWKKSLLDLSFRNPLLKIRKPSSIFFMMPPGAIGLLEDRISDDRTVALRSDEVLRSHQSRLDLDDPSVQASLMQELRDGDTTFTELSENALERRVTSLRRRAKEAREETGADNLYLVLGVLEWAEGTTQAAAPVFLLPVSLRGGRKGERATYLFDHTREFEPNFCLYEKLKATYNIEIPELLNPAADAYGIDLEAMFQQIRTRLAKAGASQFSLWDRACLSTFQFSTLTMWRDLSENWNQLTKSKPVQHLVENSGDVSSLKLNGSGGTARLTETKAFAPLPVDSAQLAAIDLACQGTSFVLEGPPGTGKSQTITNMIAHALAQGSKVLFVAEKQAALEVVQRRLESVGLGKFILELHGEHQTRSSVREHLQASLEFDGAKERDFHRAERTYKRSVDYLNDYARRIHTEGTSGMSLWTAHEAVLNASFFGRRGQDPAQLPRRLVLKESSVERLQKMAGDVEVAMLALDGLPQDSPWSLTDLHSPLSEGQLDQVERSVATLSELYSRLSPSQLDLIGALSSQSDLDIVLEWAEANIPGLAVPPEAAFRARSSWLAQADQQVAALARAVDEKNPGTLGFSNGVLDLDLDGLLERSQEIDSRVFGKSKRRDQLLEELRPVLLGTALDRDAITNALLEAVELRNLNQQWQTYFAGQTGVRVDDSFSIYEPETIESLRGQILGWQVSAELGELLQAEPEIRELVDSVLPVSAETLSTIRRFAAAWWTLQELLKASDSSRERWRDGRSWRVAVQESLEDWTIDAHLGLRGLRAYLRAAEALGMLKTLGIGDFVDQVWSGDLASLDIADEMDRAIYAAIQEERLQAEHLKNFDPGDRELMAARFIENGAEYRKAIESTITERLLSNRATQLTPETEADLRSQLGRRRNAMSVRQLMAHYFPAISALTPCFLMSPSSVAKFLPPDNGLFDLVIFDEASQIRVPQAIGSMGRGQSVVVVGDSQQMPPSSMFVARLTESDDLEEDPEQQAVVPVDMESILSEAVESNFERHMLLWHYRSRDESLIAFSNSRYYEDRLASFPSPPRITDSPPKAVSLVRVEGKWEGGSRSARVNRVEAQEIVSAVVDQLDSDPTKSIGIITFNIQQRDLILDLIERQATTSPSVAEALAREDAPLFVKNLENVQGDERDIIFFSLAFSPDENGRIPLNWGPLSRAGGEKRLNVAVTRAKERVKVFASFDPRSFDLGASRSLGLKHLREYLIQAQDPQSLKRSQGAHHSDPHHEEVYRALKDAGLQVQEHIGLSDFVLDLAVAVPGKRWLGILLEGPDWYDRFSVSDREGLPRNVLTNQMGWAAVRTLSLPEWIKDSSAVIGSIVKEAQSLPPIDEEPVIGVESLATVGQLKGSVAQVAKPQRSETVTPEPVSPGPASDITPGDTPSDEVGSQREPRRQFPTWPRPSMGRSVAEPAGQPVVQPTAQSAVQPAAQFTAQSTDPLVPLDSAEQPEPFSQPSSAFDEVPDRPAEFLAASTDVRYERRILDERPRLALRLLKEQALDIVLEEGPISEDRLLSILGQRFDLKRLQGSRVRQLCAGLPKQLARRNELGEVFYWPDLDSDTYTSFRERGDREGTDIALEELVNAMRSVLSQASHLGEEELLRETRKIFDIGRLGSRIKPRFDRAYQIVRAGDVF